MNQSFAFLLSYVKTNQSCICARVPQNSSLPQSCAEEKSSGVVIVNALMYLKAQNAHVLQLSREEFVHDRKETTTGHVKTLTADGCRPYRLEKNT